jgi:hypothetical protein
MPRVRFESTTPVFEQAKIIHALDRAATVISTNLQYQCKIHPHTRKRVSTPGPVRIHRLQCKYLQLANAHFHALTQPFAPGEE